MTQQAFEELVIDRLNGVISAQDDLMLSEEIARDDGRASEWRAVRLGWWDWRDSSNMAQGASMSDSLSVTEQSEIRSSLFAPGVPESGSGLANQTTKVTGAHSSHRKRWGRRRSARHAAMRLIGGISLAAALVLLVPLLPLGDASIDGSSPESLSKLRHASAGVRVQAIYAGLLNHDADSDFHGTLIRVLGQDTSTNVRLAALDVLSDVDLGAESEADLLEQLPAQPSALIQMQILNRAHHRGVRLPAELIERLRASQDVSGLVDRRLAEISTSS